MERDAITLVNSISKTHFNSHAHVERDLLVLEGFSMFLHFNSHAHVERDFDEFDENKEYVISTHTLTWSVTICLKSQKIIIHISTHTLTWSVTGWAHNKAHYVNKISTHTLTWSVTSSPQFTPIFNVHFNSHAHVERD